ncbi:hypothetical protein [Nocardioides sp.]|uniref:alpha/beta hydrolase n=1 Tax=Nocardioides sp. TaxID=35761 RepID=UPI002C53AC28|nr:hypothetical protein [Nocardioides sp.]HXH76861.1 hypothetical protein [Nocardioides sp.]
MPQRRHLRQGLGFLLAAALLLTGCGAEGSTDADAPAPSPTSEPPSEATSEATSDSTSGHETIAERCSGSTPPDATLDNLTVKGDGMTIPAVAVRPTGRPRAVAVLLPQTTGGLCGWLPYAARLATRGVLAVSMDVCGYGATCRGTITHRIEVQVDAVLAHVGAPDAPVTLIGASMGGSQTVRAVARGAGVDAWVDVSGLSAWDGDNLIDLAPDITKPGLVVYARSDGPLEFGRARQLARATGARFHEAPIGHGWDLVLRGSSNRPTRAGTVIEEFVLSAT